MRFLIFTAVLNCKADIWYGDTEIADVVNQAGIYNGDERYNTRKMFDENPSTYWHSDDDFKYGLKVIGIEFKVRIRPTLVQVVPNNSERLLKIGSHNGLIGLFSTEFDGHSQPRGGRGRQRTMAHG